MVANAGDEFRASATPGPELRRLLVYLAEIGSRAVLPRGFTARTAFASADAGANSAITQAMLRAARLADPAYQEMSTRITGKLTKMDEASVAALQDIEREMQELARERERLRERAYRDERGWGIFMTEDESAAYYEDGSRVADDEFTVLRDALRGKTTREQWQAHRRRWEALDEERAQIHRQDEERADLREQLRSGALSQQDAEQREREIEESLPARVRVRYARRTPAPDAELQTAAPGDAHAPVGPHLLPPQR
jgi:hypothetical protein